MLNPVFAIDFKPETRWSFFFVFANEDLIYKDDQRIFISKHISLSPFVNYLVASNSLLGVGIEYKFRNIFNEKLNNEIQIFQQYLVFKKHINSKTDHRFRFEEHLKEENSYRIRYRFSMELPLGRSHKNFIFLIVNSEALWTISKNILPTFDVYTGSSIIYVISNNMRVTFGLQYRYENYTHNPYRRLFLQSGMFLSL